jgi:exodeoxyribonuclease VII large subunit
MLDRASSALTVSLERKRDRLSKVIDSTVLKSPEAILDSAKNTLLELYKKAVDLTVRAVERQKSAFSVLVGKLDALSPLSVLSRGYSVVHTDGVVVKSARELKKNADISLRFADGEALATVSEVNYEK